MFRKIRPDRFLISVLVSEKKFPPDFSRQKSEVSRFFCLSDPVKKLVQDIKNLSGRIFLNIILMKTVNFQPCSSKNVGGDRFLIQKNIVLSKTSLKLNYWNLANNDIWLFFGKSISFRAKLLGTKWQSITNANFWWVVDVCISIGSKVMAQNRSRTGADEPKFGPKLGKIGQKFGPQFFILLYKTYLAIV